MNEDEKWMKIAIDEANIAKSKGEIPVGAVLIKNGQIISQAHNQNTDCLIALRDRLPIDHYTSARELLFMLE